MNTSHILFRGCLIVLLMMLLITTPGQARVSSSETAFMSAAFTYQGQLKQGSAAVSATCDFQFSLWDDLSAGSQVGSTQTLTGVAVDNGLFSVMLNEANEFGGSAFDGGARWLEINVRCPAGSGSYSLLPPRQPITAVPYALASQMAKSASALQGITVSGTAPTSGQVLKYSGSRWEPADDAGNYQNWVVVAQSGGDFTSIQTAINSISDASASNHYVVKVMPGIYTENVAMKPYVDIEGSGEMATVIQFTGRESSTSGVLVGANNTELRFLTVENTGGSLYAIGIYSAGATMTLTHVTALAHGSSVSVIAIAAESDSNLVLKEVEAHAEGSGSPDVVGIAVKNSSVQLTNVFGSGKGGDYCTGLWTSFATVTAADLRAEGLNCSNAIGIFTYGSSTELSDVRAAAKGSTNSTGIHIAISTAFHLVNGHVSAAGGTGNAHGVWNQTSSSVIDNCTISASGASSNYGVSTYATSGSYTMQIHNSQITSNQATLNNNAYFTTSAANTFLSGGAVSGGGTLKCAGVVDEAYTFYNNTCP